MWSNNLIGTEILYATCLTSRFDLGQPLSEKDITFCNVIHYMGFDPLLVTHLCEILQSLLNLTVENDLLTLFC